MQDCLSEVGGFDQEILNVLGNLDLAIVDDLSPNPLAPCTNQIRPRIIPADMCWRNRPTYNYLIKETMAAIARSECTTFSRCEASAAVDPIQAITQLIAPDPTDPTFLTGLRLSRIEDYGFGVPSELSRVVEAFGEGNIQMHLTPKFSIVDFHIGISNIYPLARSPN